MYNTVLKPANYYKVGIYVRLSKEDDNKDKSYESESESVSNQRNLLMKYVKEHEFTFVDEYIDDGFSGTNFDRPAFNRLKEDIENGKINCVITKDLSRLGRDYVQSGYYIEQYFPLKKVRYISVLDNVDTFIDSTNNDIAPFKALFNDMTSKDTSKKIKSILKGKKENGHFIGSNPSYGYMRDPMDKHKLIPDPVTAPIVREIFKKVSEGETSSNILKWLNDEKIKTPSKYKGLKLSSRLKHDDIWTVSSLNKILKNRMYTGDMIQNVQAKLNYKSQKRIKLDKEAWIIIEDTHEALVDKVIFEKIQKSPQRIRKLNMNRERRLLEGMIYCKECGNRITVAYKRKIDYWSMNCNKYTRSPSQRLCTSHYMTYNSFEERIIEEIKSVCENFILDIDINRLKANIKLKDETIDKNLQINELNKKIGSLQNKLDVLYEDKFNGIISSDMYLRLSKTCEKEISELKYSLSLLQKEKKSEKHEVYDIEKKIKEIINIKEPSRELLNCLIDKIIIDENRNIEIKYNFKEV
ncbi:MAG: recombinase family protein [Bacilli bacterium]